MLKKPVAMKKIKNYSVQGFSIVVRNGSTFETIWLPPKQSISIREDQVTQQIRNLHNRRLIIISN